MKGIYKIENERTNRVYIGQSVDLQTRLNAHTGDLINGKHINTQLQEDFDNGDDFTFEILESTENLNEREGYWMNQYDNLYNVSGNREVEDRYCDLEVGVKYLIRRKLKFVRNSEIPFGKLVRQLRKGTISDLDQIKLFEEYPWLNDAIEYLGFKRMKTLSFVKEKIQEELELEKKKTSYRDYILESMEIEVGDFWYPSELDAKLQYVYDYQNLGEVGRLEKNKYYEYRRTARKINGKRISGLVITKIR